VSVLVSAFDHLNFTTGINTNFCVALIAKQHDTKQIENKLKYEVRKCLVWYMQGSHTIGGEHIELLKQAAST
jgi:hypothetical protein